MDSYQGELMHFVANNVDEVIVRNWANDIRRMEMAERQRDKLREAMSLIVDAESTDELYLMMRKARAALATTEEPAQ